MRGHGQWLQLRSRSNPQSRGPQSRGKGGEDVDGEELTGEVDWGGRRTGWEKEKKAEGGQKGE